MNTYELQRVIGDYVKRFDGVFSCGSLPTKPRLSVCNTDPSIMLGKHWIAIYVDDGGDYGDISTLLDEHLLDNLNIT